MSSPRLGESVEVLLDIHMRVHAARFRHTMVAIGPPADGGQNTVVPSDNMRLFQGPHPPR